MSPSLKADAAARKRSIGSVATSGVCHHRLPHAGLRGATRRRLWPLRSIRTAAHFMPDADRPIFIRQLVVRELLHHPETAV